MAEPPSAANLARPGGGYDGIFIDPDGHPWEVAHNPSWKLHPKGTISLD
jgi:uncharacterized protein